MTSLLTKSDFVYDNTVEVGAGGHELWIKAGRAYITAVHIEEKGSTLRWEFNTQPKVCVFMV